MIVKFSRHAEERMVERGISVKEVERAITSGGKFLQKPDKIVAEYRYFRVVYRKAEDIHYIITVEPRW